MTPDRPSIRLLAEHSIAAADLLLEIAHALNVYHDASLSIAQDEMKDWIARFKADERKQAEVAKVIERLTRPAKVITIREVADHDV